MRSRPAGSAAATVAGDSRGAAALGASGLRMLPRVARGSETRSAGSVRGVSSAGPVPTTEAAATCPGGGETGAAATGGAGGAVVALIVPDETAGPGVPAGAGADSVAGAAATGAAPGVAASAGGGGCGTAGGAGGC